VATSHRVSFFRNLVRRMAKCHTLVRMPQTSEAVAPALSSGLTTGQEKDRPFRVKFRGSVLALIRLPNRREVRGKLHQLSTSGGLMHLEKPLDDKLGVELIFQLGDATIREKVEMMFPMWATQGWLQPFRFIDLPEANKNALETGLRHFVQHLQERTS
jgi:hypothetical protein